MKRGARGSALLAVLLIVLAASLLGLSLVLALADREEAAEEIASEEGARATGESLGALVGELQRRIAEDPEGRPVGPEIVVQVLRLGPASNLPAREGLSERYLRVVTRAWPANAFVDINSDPRVIGPLFSSLLKIGLKGAALEARDSDPAAPPYDPLAAEAAVAVAVRRLDELRPAPAGFYSSPEEAVRRLRFAIASDLRSNSAQDPGGDALVDAIAAVNSSTPALVPAVRRELGRLDRVLAKLVERAMPVASAPTGASKDARGWSVDVARHRGLRRAFDAIDPLAPQPAEAFGPILTARAAVIGSAALALPPIGGGPAAASPRPVSAIAVNEAPLEVLAAVFAAGLRFVAHAPSSGDIEDRALELALELNERLRGTLVAASDDVRIADTAALKQFFDDSTVLAALTPEQRERWDRALLLEERLSIEAKSAWGAGPAVVAAQLLGIENSDDAFPPPPLTFQAEGLYHFEIESAVIALPPRLRAASGPLLPDALRPEPSVASSELEEIEGRLRLEGEIRSFEASAALVQVFESRRLGSAGEWRAFAAAAAPPAPELASWPQDLGALPQADAALVTTASVLDGALVQLAPRAPGRLFAALRGGDPSLAGAVTIEAQITGGLILEGSAIAPEVLSAAASNQTAEGLLVRLLNGPDKQIRWLPGATGAFDNLDRGGLSFWIYLNKDPGGASLLDFAFPLPGGQRELSIGLLVGGGLEITMDRGLFGSGSTRRWSLNGAAPLLAGSFHQVSLSWSEDALAGRIDELPLSFSPVDLGSEPIPAAAALDLGLASDSSSVVGAFALLRDLAVYQDVNGAVPVPSFARAETRVAAPWSERVPEGYRLLTGRVEGRAVESVADITVELGLSDGALSSADALSFSAATKSYPSNPRLLARQDGPTRLRARVAFLAESGPVPSDPRRLRSITALLAPPAPTVYSWRRRGPARLDPRRERPAIPESLELDALRGG